MVAEGVGVFNYAYMRKTVLDILPAGQDECSCWRCFQGKLAVSTNEHLKCVLAPLSKWADDREDNIESIMICSTRTYSESRLSSVKVFHQNSQPTVYTVCPMHRMYITAWTTTWLLFLLKKKWGDVLHFFLFSTNKEQNQQWVHSTNKYSLCSQCHAIIVPKLLSRLGVYSHASV